MIILRIKPIVLFILISLITTKVSADTFVVTSNADSGPGTLREAIQKAADNGSATQDIISFNIADQTVTGRTIDIQSEMPFLTSNLVIDASTQPGAAIGVSDAKVVLQLSKRVGGLRCFTIRNASNVEIYGLFFYQSYLNGFSGVGNNYSIYFRKANNIIIGKPGKGNYFIGFSKAIANWIDANIPENYLPSDTSNNLIVQSNIFGLALNGDLPTRTNTINGIVFTPTEQAIYLRNARDVLIGGMLPSERNFIHSQDAVTYATDSLKGNGYLKIYGNYIGGINTNGVVDFNGSSSTIHGKIWIKNTSSFYGNDIAIEIKKNRIGGSIDLGYLSNDAVIQSNTITNTNIFTNYTTDGLYLSSALIKVISQSGKVMIGGDDPTDGNDISLIRYVDPFPLPAYGQFAIQSGASSILKGAVEIKNNTIHCNTTESSSIYNGSQSVPDYTNKDTSSIWVIIDSTGNGFVQGRASRNSRIDIYLDDECRACEGKQMIGSTLSDASGKWSFTGNFSTVVVATATKRGHTWGFSTPVIITDSAKIQHPTCKENNGYIKGLKMIGGDNFEWRYNPDPIFTDFSKSVFYSNTSLDITGLKAGTYFLVGKLGNTCSGWRTFYILKNYSPKIGNFAVITNATCGRFNGSITRLSLDSTDYCRFEWRSSSGVVVSTEKDLRNAGPGTYKFFAIDTTVGGGCVDSSIAFTITNQSGPTVNINNLQVKHASCNQPNGSIQNIQILNATGSSYFRWEDSLQKVVGNTIDLLNVNGGKYRLKFKDAGSCDTITTSFFIIENKGWITIDSSNKIIKPSGCNLKNGSIKGLLITGGDLFEWKDNTNNTIVSTGTDAINLDPGNYQLSIKNNTGCSQLLPVVIVPASTFIPIIVTASTLTNATCNIANGSIKNLVFSADTAKYSFLWTDSLSKLPVGPGTSLINIGNGSFVLSATDINGCSQSIFKASILQHPTPTFDSSNLLAIADECNQHTGGIKNMNINNLIGPTIYEWTNSSSIVVSNTKDVLSIGTGYYQLKVIDAATCIIKSNPVFIKDNLAKQITPVYGDTTIARNTPVFLTIKNFAAGTYLLFKNPTTSIPLEQNTTGLFTIPNVATDRKIYIEYQKGSCSSERTEVNIKTVDETNLSIPNIFSPNGDGINDFFKIGITGLFTLKELIIFNREGQQMFNTKDINMSWDGKYKGKLVPVGTYYYTMQGSDLYNKPVFKQGSITLLR